MECPRCGNRDERYFYKGSRGVYCRKCVRFKRILLEEEIGELSYDVKLGVEEYTLRYELTKDQKRASKECLEALKKGDVLLSCVCGAGKTEITIESISSFLKEGKKVCFAIARREVVIELSKRFQEIFSEAEVIAVYGGHHEKTTGDLIVCTAHQLYRYHHTFDLLIIDEADAYPLSGDETLYGIALSSCRGRILYSTATVDETLKKVLSRRPYTTVSLFVRPSYEPLPLPSCFLAPVLFSFLYLLYLFHREKGQIIVFLPEKKLTKLYWSLFRHFVSSTYVYSDLPSREEAIREFREGRKRVIFSTSVLERGVTIRNVSVIILDIRKGIFNVSSLIQMLGRLRRGIGDLKGEGYIFLNRYDPAVTEAIRTLKEANAHL